MSLISFTMYYVGHGSMFYAKVYDRDRKLEMQILVDAGSTSDATGWEADANKERVIEEIMENNVPLIVCLTHLHRDHYSFLTDLFKKINREERWDMLAAFIVGSMHRGIDTDELIRYSGEFQQLAYLVSGQKEDAWWPLDIVDEETDLWISKEGDVRLSVLFNCLCGYGDENDNSAVFCLRHLESSNLVIFTGDITGATLQRIDECSAYKEALRKGLARYFVYMTIPHHGSIHTLEKEYFVMNRNRYGGNIYTTKNLNNFFRAIGFKKGGLLLSSGVLDLHGHPDFFVVRMFYPYAKRDHIFQEIVPCYVTYDEPGYSVILDMPLPDEGWYGFENMRQFYTTVHVKRVNHVPTLETKDAHIHMEWEPPI